MTSAAPAPLSARTGAAIFALWIAIAAILLPNSIGIESRLDARALVAGSEHERAQALIAREFDAVLVDPLVLVIEGLDLSVGAGAQTLGGLVEAIGAAAPRARVLSYLDQIDPLFLGDNGQSTVVLVGLPRAGPDRAAMMARASEAAASYISAESPSLRLNWTSESLLNDELRALSAHDASTAEIRILPLALVLLFIAFGSVTAGLAPVAVGVLTVALARGALALIDNAAPLSFLSANVATMLGLGLSIDYSLLVVSRFREEMARAADARTAAAATARSAGVTVVLAGLGVATALAALLITPISEVRSIAIAGLVVVAAAVSVSVTLLPAILAVVGSRIDVFAFFRRRMASTSQALWRAWGRIVFARPILLLVVGAAPLLALGVHCVRLDINLPRGDWLPASMHAAETAGALGRAGRTGLLQTLLVAVEFDAPGGVASARGWRALGELSARLGADPRVLAARSIQKVVGTAPDAWRGLGQLPGEAREMYLSKDNRSALIAVIPRAGLELHELSQLVRDLRKAPPVEGVAAIHIGGPPALNADYAGAVTRWFAPVAAMVLGATFIILALGLRSLLLPLKAVALNLLSVAAALGAMTLVFQDGFGAELLGLGGGYGGVFPVIPILVFAIVFGLSMDYEVFLFHRVVEAHRDGASNLEAMTSGLQATAGVITSAAALMILVFGAFMLGEFLFMKMLGFSLAAAILIDSVLVRLLLGPALFAIAGRWNWWPFGRRA
jgi:putative drug exporter of the RND superfamily